MERRKRGRGWSGRVLPHPQAGRLVQVMVEGL